MGGERGMDGKRGEREKDGIMGKGVGKGKKKEGKYFFCWSIPSTMFLGLKFCLG